MWKIYEKLPAQLFQWLEKMKNLLKYPNLTAITVERVNPPPAFLQMRLLCHLTVDWEGFQPFSSPMYQPLSEAVAILE